MSTGSLANTNSSMNYVAKIYFWSVSFIGILSFIATISSTSFSNITSKFLFEFLFFVVLNIIAELAITNLPTGGSLTASFSVILTALLVQGPFSAIVSAVAGATFSSRYIQNRPWRVIGFNASLFSIIFFIAGLSIDFLKKIFTFEQDELLFSVFLLCFTVTIIYMLLSSIIVNTYICITRGISFIETLKEDRWEFTQLLILTPISILGVYFYYSIGLPATLAAFFPAIIMVYWIRSYIDMNVSNENLKSFTESLENLYGITKEINMQNDTKSLWRKIISDTNSIIPYDNCIIYKISTDHTYLTREETDLMYAPEEHYDLLDIGVLQDCVAKRKLILIDKFNAPVNYQNIWASFRSVLAVPITLEGEIWGVFCLVSKERKAFSSEHTKFIKILISSIETTLKNIKLYEQTQRQALIDGLTGLYNQKYFKNQVSVELSRAIQNKLEISIIMLDMDYFKKFNDTHGHLLGDLVLKDLGKIIKSIVKNTYVVSRYGGEEFGILLPETSLINAAEIGEQIRTKVTEHVFVGREQSEVKMTVSVGVSTHIYNKGNLSANDFIDRADTALYRAKNEGRNQVYTAVYSDSNDQLIVRRFSKNDKDVDRKNVYVFSLDKSASDIWIGVFEKFSLWVISEENTHSKQINDTYKDFFVKFIIKKLENPDIKLNAILLEEDVEREILSKLYFPTDFYKFEVEIEEIERVIFDYIGTIKASEIEKDHIRKIVIGIFNKVYAMAIKYTSNHYQKIIDYHMNIAHINSKIGSISTKQTFYSNITKLTSEILNSKYSFIAELDSIKKVLHIKSFYGVNDFSISEVLENAGFMVHKITQRLISYGDVIQLNSEEISQAFGSYKEKLDAKSVILVPLVKSDKQVTGVLACIDDKERTFNNEEINICKEISERIVKAITRIQKNISEKESYLEVMKSMVDLFESSSQETKDHSKNVSRLAGRISRAMNIPKEDEFEIRTAAYLHDIGKLNFSTEKLLDEESLKSHPLIGARILGNIPELNRITQAIRHHHENWNGTGYPDGLEGSEIPLYSRIISVSNKYPDYLKEYLDSDIAIDKMKESNLFDPNICDILKDKIFGK